MESDLITRLSPETSKEKDVELAKTLNQVLSSLKNESWEGNHGNLVSQCFSLVCGRNLFFVNDKLRDPEEAASPQELAMIIIIKLLKTKKNTSKKLTELVLNSLDKSPSASREYLQILRVMSVLLEHSEELCSFIPKSDYLDFFMEIFEAASSEYLKKAETPEKRGFIQKLAGERIKNKEGFSERLAKHIMANYPKAVRWLNDGGGSLKEAGKLGEGIQETLGGEAGAAAGAFSIRATQTMNSLNTSVANGPGQYGKAASKVPILNIPIAADDGVNIPSRSTRRNDPFQSISSNRISIAGSNSIDSGKKQIKRGIPLPELNMSFLDANNENSQIVDDIVLGGVICKEQVAKVQSDSSSPFDLMSGIAQKIGEFYLTMDMSCILTQKRRAQVDCLAKNSVVHGLHTLVDMKNEEKKLRQTLRKLESGKDHLGSFFAKNSQAHQMSSKSLLLQNPQDSSKEASFLSQKYVLALKIMQALLKNDSVSAQTRKTFFNSLYSSITSSAFQEITQSESATNPLLKNAIKRLDQRLDLILERLDILNPAFPQVLTETMKALSMSIKSSNAGVSPFAAMEESMPSLLKLKKLFVDLTFFGKTDIELCQDEMSPWERNKNQSLKLKRLFLVGQPLVFCSYLEVIRALAKVVPTSSYSMFLVSTFIGNDLFQNIFGFFANFTLSEHLTWLERVNKAFDQELETSGETKTPQAASSSSSGPHRRGLSADFSNSNGKVVPFFGSLSKKEEVEYNSENLFVFSTVLSFCKSIATLCQNQFKNKEKLSPSEYKKWKETYQRIFEWLYRLLKVNSGMLAKVLNASTSIISLLNKIDFDEEVKGNEVLRVRFDCIIELLELIRCIFRLPNKKKNTVFSQNTIGFYLRFAFINLVKLYSHSNYKELAEVNKKITEKTKNQKEIPLESNSQINFEEKSPQKRKSKRMELCQSLAQVLFALSVSRNEEISEYFHQLQVLDFFSREIDLEMEVNQLRNRFLNVRKEEKEALKQKPAHSKPFVPPLSTSGLGKTENKEKNTEPKVQKLNTLNLGLKLQQLEERKNSSESKDPVASNKNESRVEEEMNANLFYYCERKARKIYENNDLHALIVSLIISLALTPTRGVLDETYCKQYPLDQGKSNILYTLHHHLNHPSNQAIIPLVSENLSQLQCFPAGQRLMKLLCRSLSDISIYSSWSKVAQGAYGTVFRCKTSMVNPETVAIKIMKVPSSIFDRCVLHDIFGEITCLEKFRLESSVVEIYDYGVTETDYFIVMKMYPISLREWRLKQSERWSENLSAYLHIFMDILKAVQLLHANHVVHYDIKCDNILLTWKPKEDSKLSVEDYSITLADFGECRMFMDDDNELCARNRGTEYIKSPEMLLLTFQNKTENDSFDRRKKLGTSRASDVWSLGCLLFELLTGKYLFFDQDYFRYILRVTKESEVLLTEERLNEIENNVYIVDFLKYVLIRNPQLRPSIDNVVLRFEHVISLLDFSPNRRRPPCFSFLEKSPSEKCSEALLSDDSCRNLLEGNYLDKSTEKLLKKAIVDLENDPLEKSEILGRGRLDFIQILKDLAFCSSIYFLVNKELIHQMRFTHLISFSLELPESVSKRFDLLSLPNQAVYTLLPKTLDFLREAIFRKGRVLFIDDDSEPSFAIKRVLVYCLAYFFSASVFETYTLLNTQTLFFAIPKRILEDMSVIWCQQMKIFSFFYGYPVIKCNCEANQIFLNQPLMTKSSSIISCRCSRKHGDSQFSECPSDGCLEYLKSLNKYFGSSLHELKWLILDPSDFLLGPAKETPVKKPTKRTFLTLSMNWEENTVLYQKQSTRPSPIDNEFWSIFMCKKCLQWVYASNSSRTRFGILEHSIGEKTSKGILSRIKKSGDAQAKVVTPILKNYSLGDFKSNLVYKEL